MNASLAEVCCARVPVESLAHLAPLRVREGIRIRLLDDYAWLWWTAGDAVVLPLVLALEGVQLFERRAGAWYRPGRHLPAFEVPSEAEARPLLHVLTPLPVRAESQAPLFAPLRLRLVRDDCPRAASALCCPLTALAEWAEQATTKQLRSLLAVRAGERVLLRGERLPPLTEGERFWGGTIWTPLGLRPEPELSEGALREALRLRDREIALLREEGFESIDADLFQPQTRAGVRLAAAEGR